MSSGRILDEKPFLSGVLFFFFLTIHRGKSIILQKARFEHTESESWEYEKTISKKKNFKQKDGSFLRALSADKKRYN